MNCLSTDSLSDIKVVDFGSIPVDTISEQNVYITNISDQPNSYRVAVMYTMNTLDRAFKVIISSQLVKPGENAELKIMFRPLIVGQSFSEYYIIDDDVGNTYKISVTGKSFGPVVTFNKRKLKFDIRKNEKEQRTHTITMTNSSAVESTFQWLIPEGGLGNFHISIGNCGLIRPFESITVTVLFTGAALGVYTAELVCLVLHQEPLFLDVIARVLKPGNPIFDNNEHSFEKNWKKKSRSAHLMENSLNRLTYIPSATVFERYLDFGCGSVFDVSKNISQTLCVTNHENVDGYIQWISDPDNIFIVDPVATVIPPHESKLFTVRFRPKIDNEVYSYLMCGDYQHKITIEGEKNVEKVKHTNFRIPCIGNTWSACTEWTTEWDCPPEVQLPPTVPARSTFCNFMLSNRLDIPMYYRFQAPYATNFVVVPMCGIVPSRGWHIITVALEPKSFGDYYETWDLTVNKVQKTRVCFCGNAEISQVEVMSHGYNPATHAMYEFPPTITGAINYCTAYFHNVTRMEIHMRVLCAVSWLGADNGGSIILPPKEIVRFHWWFFPKTPDLVYDTTVTCTCVCLIDGKPVGEPTELFIHVYGFSELPDLRVLPRRNNLHDVPVGESASLTVTLYNHGSCFYTSRLYYTIDGMDDDWSGDKFEIDAPVNSLKPSNHCMVTFTVIPDGAGSRQIDVKYTILFRTEYDEIEEIQPITKTICIIWYDGIYPTIKIKRTICVKSPVIMTNHCVWNITNVKAFNKALEVCRPNQPLAVDLYAPDLCSQAYVELIFVMGCVYHVPVPWNLRREKICDCEMVEIQIGISTYTMRHTCVHRPLIELAPLSGIVSKGNPNMLYITFKYDRLEKNTLCYVMTMPNERVIYINLHIFTHPLSRGILIPSRRPVEDPSYLALLECGTVPINNLDPVIRVVWVYNPTNVFTTWRLLRGNTITPDVVIRCLLYFAEVPPLGKLPIPFAFMPTEMIDYETVFYCSFGYETESIKVNGKGGLPNCVETRLDIPSYTEKIIRSVYRNDVVYLSRDHITIPIMPTHSLWRELICICNDTDHIIRFIWLPERIANIVNIVMTPCWGVMQAKSTEWITMTIYTLQEPATFTTSLACELLDLTERRRYQKNELLRRNKIEKCNQEFIITEKGFFHPNINDSPPYVLDIKKTLPTHIAMTVSISSKGQRDGYPRMLLNKMWEQTPPYDLLSTDLTDYGSGGVEKSTSANNMTMPDIVKIIDGILWDALHSKMLKNQLEFYAKEEIPTYELLVKKLQTDIKPRLSRRVTSGICDAIVNKGVFHIYELNPKHETSVLEAEEEE